MAVVETRSRDPETTRDRRPPNWARRREHRVAFVFLAPWFLGLGLITLGPILASFYCPSPTTPC